MEQKNNVDAILFHIEHSKPIEISEFVTSLNAIGNLFSLFAKKNGDCKEAAKSKLYVEKIEELAHIRMDFRGIMQSAWTRKG